MTIIVTCPGCGQRHQANETLAGRVLACPGCGSSVQVPASQPGPVADPLGLPSTSELPSLGTVGIAPQRKKRRRRSPLSAQAWMMIVGLSLFGLAAIAIIIPTAMAFKRGYDKGVAFRRGTTEWKSYTSGEYGFTAQLPANYIEAPTEINNVRGIQVEAKHSQDVVVSVTLVRAADVHNWPARLFRFESIEGVVRLPATGHVVHTQTIEGEDAYEWNCAMVWGDCFCWVYMTGRRAEDVEAIANEVFDSLEFRLVSE